MSCVILIRKEEGQCVDEGEERRAKKLGVGADFLPCMRSFLRSDYILVLSLLPFMKLDYSVELYTVVSC